MRSMYKIRGRSKPARRPNRRPRTAPRPAVRGVAALVAILLAGTVLFSGAAQAATLSKGSGITKGSDVWYGNYAAGSDRGYCGDPIASGATFYGPTEHGGSSYGAVKSATTWDPKTTGVGALSATNVKRLAYVLSTSGSTSSNAQSAHVSYAVRTFVSSPGGAKGTATPYAGDLKSGGEKLVAEAKRYAGPYTIALKFTLSSNKQSATVSSYRPVSATGNTMTGYTGTLALSGPAVFASNGKKTIAAPAGGTPLDVHATSDGAVSVRVSYAGMPSTKLYHRDPSRSDFQRILISGRTEPVSASASVTADVPNKPVIATETSDRVASSGATLTDKLHISALVPNSTVTAHSTLYGPFVEQPVESPAPPLGAPVAGRTSTTVTANAGGVADAITSDIKLTAPGYYVWFETTDATLQNLAWPGRFGQQPETTVVKWAPHVTTVTSQQRAKPGAKITDTLLVTGLPPGTRTVVTSTLYGPFTTRPAGSADVPTGANIVGTVTTNVTADDAGGATATTDPLTVNSAGFYVWHETIAPGATYEKWAGRFGQETETTIVPWHPTVTTQTSDQEAAPGTKITDTLKVSGLQPGASINVRTTLYGPYDQAPKLANEPPEDTPKVGAFTIKVTAGQDGAATALTPALEVTKAGFYVWHETIAADDQHDAWVAPFGQATETTHVNQPPVPKTPYTPGTPNSSTTQHLPDTGAPPMKAALVMAVGLILSGCTALGLRSRLGRRDAESRDDPQDTTR